MTVFAHSRVLFRVFVGVNIILPAAKLDFGILALRPIHINLLFFAISHGKVFNLATPVEVGKLPRKMPSANVVWSWEKTQT